MIFAVVILLAYAYQYFDELQDRSVNSDWQGDEFWAKIFSLHFLNKRPYGWRRKWKNGNKSEGSAFFLSNGPLVAFTDGEHFFQLCKQLSITALLSILFWPLGIMFFIAVHLQGWSKRFTNLR